MLREDAIAELAKRRLAQMTDEQRAEQLGCMLHENWPGMPEELTSPASSARYDPLLLMWLHSEYAPVANDYLREELGVDEEITGEPESREPCPCCGRRTLGELGGYEICPVCRWEDDGQDNHSADVVMGGPNGKFSLTQARVNYLREGCAKGAPARMYAPGRQFLLTDDGISEVGTRWRSQSFDRE